MNLYIKISFIICFTILGSFIGWYKSNSKVTTQYETVIFATVVSSDNNSSVEEKETSSHFFAEEVLGWTLAPNFKNNLNFEFSGRKQERGNIIFTFVSETKDIAKINAKKLIHFLEIKLQNYNLLANTQFHLLLEDPVITVKNLHKSFWIMGGGVFAFFFSLFIIELFIFLKKYSKKI